MALPSLQNYWSHIVNHVPSQFVNHVSLDMISSPTTGETTPPSCSARHRLAAARSHFGSNSPPDCYSLPKCRFATLHRGGLETGGAAREPCLSFKIAEALRYLRPTGGCAGNWGAEDVAPYGGMAGTGSMLRVNPMIAPTEKRREWGNALRNLYPRPTGERRKPFRNRNSREKDSHVNKNILQ